MLQKIILLGLSTSVLLMADGGIGIDFNQDVFELEGVLNLEKQNHKETTGTKFQLDFNYMDNEDAPKTIYGIGIGATNRIDSIEGLELTLGTKYIGGNLDEEEDFSALPLMVKARYDLSSLISTVPSASIELKALYAPDALSFGESKKYSEFRISTDVEVMDNVVIYGGYRNIRTDFNDISDKTFDNNLYAGLKFIY